MNAGWLDSKSFQSLIVSIIKQQEIYWGIIKTDGHFSITKCSGTSWAIPQVVLLKYFIDKG